jgi:phage-related tail fiber protein
MFKINKKKLGITLVACLIFVVLAGGSVSSNEKTSEMAESYPETKQTTTNTKTEEVSEQKTEEVAQAPDLEVLELESVSDEYTRYATGKIRNNNNKTYGYVQVQLNVLDEAGSVVGSTMSNMNNLDPGQTWSFKAPIFEDNAVTFEITDVTGF